MKEYVNLLGYFQEWNPEIIEKMKNCSHHLDSQNKSPHHMEDTVWTHTILMYKDVLENYDLMADDFAEIVGNFDWSFDYTFEYLFYFLTISILCHDIGKIYNRFSPNGQYGKIAMYGHSYSSIQPVIDFLSFLEREKGISFTNDEIYIILNVISNHMDYYQLDVKNRVKLANYNFDNFYLGEMLNAIDRRNSIDINLDFLQIQFINYENVLMHIGFKYILDKGKEPNPELILYCGVPGSGKDYLASNYVLPTFSYDDIRINEYLKENSEEKYCNSHTLYKKAWEWCNEQKVNLNTLLKENIDLFGEGIICNVNLTRKARRSLCNLFKDYRIKIIYIGVKSDLLHYRNENRSSKKLDRNIVNKFMFNQQIPSFFEGNNIVSIEFILNN